MDWPYSDRPAAVCWSLVDGRWWRVAGGSETAMRISCARRIEAASGVVSESNRWGRRAPGAVFRVTVGLAKSDAHPYIEPALPS